MSRDKVTVIGSGLMGSGIAQVAAVSGQQVFLVDRTDEILKTARSKIEWSLNKLAEKGQLAEGVTVVLDRITFNTDRASCVRQSDFIIEAVFEDIRLKQQIIEAVGEEASAGAVIATNSSGLSITAIAEAASNKSRVIGMHWFNPPQLSRVIEVIQSKYTNDTALQATLEMCRRYRKEVVRSKKDVWFFLANRVRLGFSNEANLMYLNGEADFRAIDAVARYKIGLPMGDFELADYTGRVDNRTESYRSATQILKDFPDFEPWPAFLKIQDLLMAKMYGPMKEKGLIGVKTGKGFYEHPGGKFVKPDLAMELAESFDPVELLAPVINVSAWCVTNGVGTAEDVDKSFRLAFGWPRGIFEIAGDYGSDRVIDVLETKHTRAPALIKDYYAVDPLLKELLAKS